MKKKLKVLAVCGFGVGTSLILRMNVEKILSKHQIEAEVEHVDVTSAVGMPADVVVTSREIAEQIIEHFKVPVIIINNFMDMKEIETKCIEVIETL
ncbi:MAG: PTS sugar transporter subunit IIB [Lachnospiraceae bacterium]